MSLTKAELADSLSSKVGLNKQDAKEIVDSFFAEISNALAAGDEVKISGFGNFTLKDKKARPGRNPRTGIEVTISERRVVTFKQGQKLKEKISNIKQPELEELA